MSKNSCLEREHVTHIFLGFVMSLRRFITLAKHGLHHILFGFKGRT